MQPKPCVSVVSPLKSDHLINFCVRLNLNNPRHRVAWELLKSSGASYATTIVDALVAVQEGKVQSDLLQQMERTFRCVLDEKLQAVSVVPGAVEMAEAAPQAMGEISDEDFDIADSFMSSLGM